MRRDTAKLCESSGAGAGKKKVDRAQLDAAFTLYYPAVMHDFYDVFSGRGQVSDRGGRPEVAEILPNLFVGEYPREEDIGWLKEEFGVSAVLNLQDADDLAGKGLSLPGLIREYRRHGIKFHRIPIADFDCQHLAQVLPQALKDLQALVQEGHRVYLHCNAGCNRAPTLAIAFLHVHHRMSLEDARDFVKARRACGPYMEILYRHFGVK